MTLIGSFKTLLSVQLVLIFRTATSSKVCTNHVIFKTIKCNRLWELQCKQCTYVPTAEGPHLLLLFPSGVMPSRAGRLSWALQSRSDTVPACLPSSSSSPECRLWLLTAGTEIRDGEVKLAMLAFPCPCVHLTLLRHRRGVVRQLDTSMTKVTCRSGELNSRSDELSYRAGVARVHHSL